jgi:hypothetical protein
VKEEDDELRSQSLGVGVKMEGSEVRMDDVVLIELNTLSLSWSEG